MLVYFIFCLSAVALFVIAIGYDFFTLHQNLQAKLHNTTSQVTSIFQEHFETGKSLIESHFNTTLEDQLSRFNHTADQRLWDYLYDKALQAEQDQVMELFSLAQDSYGFGNILLDIVSLNRGAWNMFSSSLAFVLQ